MGWCIPDLNISVAPAICTVHGRPNLALEGVGVLHQLPMASEPFKLFRRALHSKGDLRRGLSAARLTIPARNYRLVVKEMAETPIYLRTIVTNSFPKTLNELLLRPRPRRLERKDELLWCSAVLSLFVEHLRDFVAYREIFDAAMLHGRMGEAESALQEIEAQFGQSVWLIKNKLLFRQVAYGISEQKEYLEEVLSAETLHAALPVLSYYMSSRVEDNTHKLTFDLQTDEIVRAGDIGDYFLYHIRTYDLSWIKAPETVVLWDESMTVVDRFESLVAMCSLVLAREGSGAKEEIAEVLLGLEDIQDPRIECMRYCLEDAYVPEAWLPSMAPFDTYTMGHYAEVVAGKQGSAELVARAKIHGGGDISTGNVFGSVADSMAAMLAGSSGYLQAKDALAKVAVRYAGKPISTDIAEFLDRDHVTSRVAASSAQHRYAGLTRGSINPWDLKSLEEIRGNGSSLAAMDVRFSGSPTLQLIAATVPNAVLPAGLPAHRSDKYRGDAMMAAGRLSEAIQAYVQAVAEAPPAARLLASSSLCLAHLKNGDIEEALRLIAEDYLLAPDSFHAYPIEDVLREVDIFAHSGLDLAIVLYIAAHDIDPKWYAELSDVFENVLAALGVSTPSELLARSGPFDGRQVAFLRHVCVPRLMDDTTVFDGVSQVERERIQICQGLVDIDPDNQNEYTTEIRAITRAGQVADLLQQIDAGKIYVDEEGIRDAVDGSLRPTFARFKTLPESRSLARHSSRISSQIADLLGDSAKQVDIRLPKSEADAMLGNMLTEYTNHFALNPAFGLDTHLSTSIRHGAFEGHIRRPLAVQNLLCEFDTKSGTFLADPTWRDKLEHLDEGRLLVVTTALGRLTERVNELLKDYRENRLRIKGDGPSGAFDFTLSREAEPQFVSDAKSAASYDDLIPILNAYCWGRTTQALEVVRQELHDVILKEITRALNQCLAQIESKVAHAHVVPVADAISTAKTELQAAVASVASWFKRPTKLDRKPFHFDLAVDVAARQIENCYVRTPVHPKVFVEAPSQEFCGEYFDPLVEILFLLIQNVVRHSGFNHAQDDVRIELRRDSDNLVIVVDNLLSPTIDIQARSDQANEAVKRYEHDTAMRMARQDIGSGISKLWRIMQFSLKRTHSLSMQVTDEHRFITEITFSAEGMLV